MRIVSVIAGLANTMKASAVNQALLSANIDHVLIDLGAFSTPHGKALYVELKLPEPILILSTKSTEYLKTLSHQVSSIASILHTIKPEVMLVYGDLNGIVPACIAALYESIPVAHIEAGLRNKDPFDTEEINRIIASRFARYHFTISDQGTANLLAEGIDSSSIICVGNTIIDCLFNYMPEVSEFAMSDRSLPKKYGLVTIHRESNLEASENLRPIITSLMQIQEVIHLVFIVYPSTEIALQKHNLLSTLKESKNLKMIKRQRYTDYLGLLANATLVLTDSSGIQDESSFLKIPCFTLLNTTHRADTLLFGTNEIVGNSSATTISNKILQFLSNHQNLQTTNNNLPLYWDGKASHRIVRNLIDLNHVNIY